MKNQSKPSNLSRKRLDELVWRDNELSLIITLIEHIRANEAYLRERMDQELVSLRLEKETELWLRELFDIDEALSATPVGSDPPGLSVQRQKYRNEMRQHRDVLKTLLRDISLVTGNKKACARSVHASCVRLIAQLDDLRLARTEEAAARFENEARQLLAAGMSDGEMMYNLRKRVDSESSVLQALDTLRFLQAQLGEELHQKLYVDTYSVAELNALQSDLEDAILELKTRPDTRREKEAS